MPLSALPVAHPVAATAALHTRSAPPPFSHSRVCPASDRRPAAFLPLRAGSRPLNAHAGGPPRGHGSTAGSGGRREPAVRATATVAVAAAGSGELAAFPRDYDEAIRQAQQATQAALTDGRSLLEVEFPTASLDSVPGDAEGGIEMTSSMRLLREYCLMFAQRGPPPSAVRLFFPDANELPAARDVFEGTAFALDCLTKPTGLEDIGFSRKLPLADRVVASDRLFVAAYPYFNVNEMLAVDDLYRDVASKQGQPIIVFNGELDRIRSGYYPSFFYPKLAQVNKSLLPLFEAVYYIHNFKGRLGGKLFRVYPGPWQVLRESANGQLICIHSQEKMPSLKEVALEILPK
ncbi:hypothetical protein CLOM_g6270 [Closterium sp. NIES-68]|nr:hypothetical protein CLOM_g6270 [Closterium sp. NIES-68]GJP82374.1 hypothetical protein CLOP_g12620 [Closterium sp. NIES-67]GJP86273.1 hypothetical protein CLOP_g16316 [Closterium sp. NIES-67]